MDAKKQEKWAEEVWRFVRDDASQPSRINSFYSERPKYEFIHQWIFNPRNAKIGKNADIVFSKIDALNFSLHDTLRNGIEQLGIPSSEYEPRTSFWREICTRLLKLHYLSAILI